MRRIRVRSTWRIVVSLFLWLTAVAVLEKGIQQELLRCKLYCYSRIHGNAMFFSDYEVK